MNIWPFRPSPKKAKFSINLHPAVQRDATVAAAWTTFAGSKVLLRMDQQAKGLPGARDLASSFDEECHARDAMAEFWGVQPPEKRQTDPYLRLMADIRQAGFIREYVWQYLRQKAWAQPSGLKSDAFASWCKSTGLAEHKPLTLAFFTIQ